MGFFKNRVALAWTLVVLGVAGLVTLAALDKLGGETAAGWAMSLIAAFATGRWAGQGGSQ